MSSNHVQTCPQKSSENQPNMSSEESEKTNLTGEKTRIIGDKVINSSGQIFYKESPDSELLRTKFFYLG